MNTNKLSVTICLTVLSILIIFTLYWFSNKPNSEKNGFNRKIVKSALKVKYEVALDNEQDRIAGIENDKIYFSDSSVGRFTITDLMLRNKKIIQVDIKNDEKSFYPFEVLIDAQHAYVMAMNKPAIIDCDLVNNSSVIHPLQRTFVNSAFISKNSFSLRMFYNTDKGADFGIGKVNLISKSLNIQESLLGNKLDGGFYTDGMLHYERKLNVLIYLMHYRNEFFCIDTNLNIIYRGKTIDTFSTSNLQIKAVRNAFDKAKWNYTFSAPAAIVNRKSYVWNEKLFVCSNIKADNENPFEFKDNSAIDIYRLKDGGYEGSFYLPFRKGKPISDFAIFNGEVIALYKDHVIIFQLGI